METFLETGQVVGTHGVRGELRVQPWCDTPAFLTTFKTLYLDKGAKTLDVEQARVHGNLVLLKVKGIATIQEAERMRGRVLYINRADAPLKEGDYFVQDLIGCAVIDADSGEQLGTLTQVSTTGANDVWHIDYHGREVLAPAIPDVVVKVEIEQQQVLLRPMKGLFDDAD